MDLWAPFPEGRDVLVAVSRGHQDHDTGPQGQDLLLSLDPDLKHQGFEAYEALRRLHLAALQTGSVRLSIGLRTRPSGPVQEVAVEVEDTGPGFDWRAWDPEAAEASTAPSGRGLLLLRALSKGLTFNETGNRIRFTIPSA